MDKRFSSEEELISYLKDNELIGLDSEYSGTSLELIEVFKAKGMDLNKWWVFTPVNWFCPSCKRTKPEIVRLNQHGYLTGHLHEHHDHMSDFVHKEFTRISENRDVVVADLMSSRFVTRTAFALSAYDNTILCSDCNSADAKAKKIVGAPREFSFSPSEISAFVIVESNKEHKIDKDAASKVWEECREIFDIRSKVVKYIAKLAASNTHWYQPSERTARETERIANSLMKFYGLKEINDVCPEYLLYKPNKFTGKKDSWRKDKKRKYARPPTQGELQHLINISKERWEKISDDWVCPICCRSKIECVRKSNKGNWSFLYSTSKVFHQSQPPEYYQYLKVCNDCSITATHIGTEAENAAGIKLSFSSSLVSPEELSEVIIANPHEKHMVSNDKIERLLIKISKRIKNSFYRL